MKKPALWLGAVVCDAAPTSPCTIVARPLLVSVAPPIGPTSTPKLAAAPMSTGPGPVQLTGWSPAITVNDAVPVISVAGSVAVIVIGPPTANPVANPLKPITLLMLAIVETSGVVVQVTDVVRICVGPAVNVPVAINCCVSPT